MLSLNPFRNPFAGATEVVAGNDGGRDGEAPSAPTSTTYSIVYVHTDALGSPVAETSTNATVIPGSRTQYEPYGKPLTTPREGAPSYTGHQHDTSTGLIYAQQRYYDPALGRFLSTDPMAVDMGAAGNWNRYAYAANNPYRLDGRSDLNLFAPTDGLYEAGKAFDIPGMFTLTGHANSTFIQGANKAQLNPYQTLALARAAGLKEGHTFFVGACNVGADGGAYAQSLADKNNSLVLAATGFVSFPTTKDPNPNDSLGPYKPGNSVTLTVNSERGGKGTPRTFAVFAPGGSGPIASGIRSVNYNPKTGQAQLRMAPETGSRIGRTMTVCVDKDKCGQ
ncbi:MAG: RHS repeat-associated core domain-containing protein [Xanthomonadales bacterium]|nr:RHS repeat-associated core domain-containing protein [Xanthomonadales bacterium]